MTDEQTPTERKADVVVTFGSIPGASDSPVAATDRAAEGSPSASSDYERVRGLLIEPGRQVGADPRSEKMAEEMESFDQRWQQRPVSPLVRAGKKMADTDGSTGLNRLLGLSIPATSAADPEPVLPEEDSKPDPAATETTNGFDEVEIPETEFAGDETAVSVVGEEDAAVISDQISEDPGPEQDEDQMTITPTTRMVAAQDAYAALSPLEAEIFRSQAGLIDSTQARTESMRAQELALNAVSSYEQETTELREQLASIRAESDQSKEVAATRVAELTVQVTTLEGRLQLATAELAAARRAESDDDSEGGAACELTMDHDDAGSDTGDIEMPSEAPEAGEQLEEIADSDIANEFELAEITEEASEDPRVESEDHGGTDLALQLERLRQGATSPAPQQNFGE